MSEIDLNSFAQKFKHNVILAPYTTWRIGGPAELFFEPADPDDVASAWMYSINKNLPFTVIGAGSNILIDDAGIPGITVCTKKSMKDFYYDEINHTITVGAGYLMSKLAIQACKNGIAGFDFLTGIPGTVGGGVVTNAGIGGPEGRSISDVLSAVKVFNTGNGKIYNVPSSELDLGYRKSNISESNLIILNAVFRADETSDPEFLMSELKKIKTKRKNDQPQEPYNAGSVFIRPNKDQSAGWYIDQAGLKGYRIGGAHISDKHANWIINDGSASSDDVKNLILFIQRKIFAEYGIQLNTEVKFLPE